MEGASASGPALSTLFCGTLLIYNLDHLRDDRQRASADPEARPRLALPWRIAALTLATLGLVGSFAAGGLPLILTSLPAGIIGLFYGARFRPGGGRLKDLPGAKAWIVAVAVSQACLFLPLHSLGIVPGLRHGGVALFLLVLTAIDAHCFDLRDLEVDAGSGASTWATRLGGQRAQVRLRHLTAAAAIVAGLAAILGWLPWSAAATLAVSWITLRWVRPGAPRERFGSVVDGWLLLPAVIVSISAFL